jgi:hypothetical protein
MSLNDASQPQPRLLDELAPEARVRLLELWAGARERQHEDLNAAIDQILQSVPRIMRGAVRKILI